MSDAGEESTPRQLAIVRAWCQDGTARTIRETADQRLTDIARKVGVSVPTVWNWEQGKQRPTGDHALVYLSLLRELVKPIPGLTWSKDR